MKIVYKCEDKDCKFPDVELVHPVDDNIVCMCGKTKWGHKDNVKKEEK